MKNTLKILSLFLALVCLLAGCEVTDEVKYEDNLDSYVVEMAYHDDFTVLQLTDIHWNSGTQIGDKTYGAQGYITKIIEETKKHAGKIDLIEITGDTFMLTNSATVKSFIDFMESFEIPYAMTWGNHDREGTYNANWLSKQFLNAEHCVYTEVDNDNVHERCNYVINLTNGTDTVWQIAHLDSGASFRQGATDMFLTYDYIRQDQYDWLCAEHKKVGNVPVLCYYHIAQAEFDTVYNEISAGSTLYKSKFFKLEGFAPSEYAIDTREFCKENNIVATFIGHAHANDWTFTTPDGLTYGLGVKTGTELYYATVEKGDTTAGFEVTESFDLVGASLVTIKDTTGKFGLEHLYLNERDEGDFIKWVNYND